MTDPTRVTKERLAHVNSKTFRIWCNETHEGVNQVSGEGGYTMSRPVKPVVGSHWSPTRNVLHAHLINEALWELEDKARLAMSTAGPVHVFDDVREGLRYQRIRRSLSGIYPSLYSHDEYNDAMRKDIVDWFRGIDT